MPAGLPYFAWIDANETTFGPEHQRWDEQVFSFTLAQEEGDPASLTVVVRRPRNLAGDPVGLLGPGRKIWVWFALDCGTDLVKFRGRLVGVPTSLFEELVTLEFVARPVDLVPQKEALAETLRVLPYYDEVVINEARRKDPDVVLEGYTKVWHFDRETHVVTVSDEINGEDGLIEFDGLSEDGKVLYDGLGLTLTSGPLSRVDITAEYTWSQQAQGTVDLTEYLISHWVPSAINGAIQLNASEWPKPGTGLGDGWEVAESSAVDLRDFTVKTQTSNPSLTVKFSDGDVSKASINENMQYLGSQPPQYNVVSKSIITSETYSTTHGDMPSLSYSVSMVRAEVVVQEIKPTLIAGYAADRQCTDRVSFTLYADVQPILTDPEDGEALRIDDIRSVNLSEPIGDVLPIGDPRRRSYVATERGNQSLEHLIALARAHLMKRARVVEISFVPKLVRMPEITLRKNVLLNEPRVGEALGKVIGYSIALDGADGRINCEVRIGCAIGRGGEAEITEGEPTYATIDYVGPDYQQFVGRTVLFDTSVGYQPPAAAPNDDGLDFMGVLRAEDVIEVDLVVEHGPDPEEEIEPPTNSGAAPPADETPFEENAREMIEARTEFIKNNWLPPYETRAKFKLKSATRKFVSDYELQVTDLKIPTGYDLEAA